MFNQKNNKEDEIKNLMFANTKKQQEEKRKRDELAFELGENITQAQTLYSSFDELKKIKEEKNSKNNFEGFATGGASSIKNISANIASGQENKKNGTAIQTNPNLNNENKSIKQKAVEFALGDGYSLFGYHYAKNKYGKDTVGMVDLSHGSKMVNRNYIKDVTHLKNYNDPAVASDKQYLKKKVSEQFKDYNFDIEKIKGYFFKNNSEPSISISKDEDFKKTLKDNKENILSGKEFSINFPKYEDNKKSNWHYALGHADVRNGYIDKEGNLRIKVYDTYDFNKNNKTMFNQAGRNVMLKGDLKPYFSIHDIIVPKKDLDELWKKK